MQVQQRLGYCTCLCDTVVYTFIVSEMFLDKRYSTPINSFKLKILVPKSKDKEDKLPDKLAIVYDFSLQQYS